jgi:PAS domain S-box-containing protein
MLESVPVFQAPSNCQAQSCQSLVDLKFVLDQAALISITGTDGVITYVNDTFCRLSQYNVDELVGQNHRMLNSKFHSPRFFEKLYANITQGKIWRNEIRNRAKDGRIFWIAMTVVPVLDELGKPHQFVAISKDITRRKVVEGELRQLMLDLEQRVQERTLELEVALNKVQESEKLRSAFVAALTHDLRTPLLAQQRAFQILQDCQADLPPRVAQLTRQLVRSNDDLLTMVGQLLETYEYEEGCITLNREPVSLWGLVQDSLDSLELLLEQHRVRFINEIPEDFPIVDVDQAQLKRALKNLLTNSIENLPAHATITIAAQRNQNFVEIELADDGPGLDQTLLTTMFERYSIGDSTKKKIGSGLGLYMTRMILELHGGKIQAESTPGLGSRYYLTLPMWEPVLW